MRSRFSCLWRAFLLASVREGGVEPPHPFEYTDLNRARLPIPPLARDAGKGYRHAYM